MLTISGSRVVVLGLALGLSFILIAPLAGRAEDLSVDLAPTIPTWDVSSGYGAVETSRAIAASPIDITNQVPVDVRWAPESSLAEAMIAAHEAVQAGYLGTMPAASVVDSVPAESIAVQAAQRALETSDPGSMVEDALLRIVAGNATWDELSGYSSLEASRAAIADPPVDPLAVAVANGTRSETAHLATIPLP